MHKGVLLAISTFVSAALAAAIPAGALAADAAKQAETAAVHANLASNASSLADAQVHLHHVVNCLVGPAGEGFDAKAGDPCKAQGNGAIPDSTDAASKKKLTSALAKAKAGIAATDLSAAKQAASDVQALLK
jgi:hypothetical protein